MWPVPSRLLKGITWWFPLCHSQSDRNKNVKCQKWITICHPYFYIRWSRWKLNDKWWWIFPYEHFSTGVKLPAPTSLHQRQLTTCDTTCLRKTGGVTMIGYRHDRLRNNHTRNRLKKKKIMFIERQQMQRFRHRKVMERNQRPIIHITNESVIGYEEDQDNDE